LSKSTIKKGIRLDIQRYFCNSCKTSFSSKRRPKKLEKSIFKQYVYKRQTLKDLSQKYNKTIQWVHYKIKEYEPQIKVHKPRPVNLVCDATFYGKRRDKLGTLVFMDSSTYEILIWKHIQKERVDDYKYLLQELLNLGYTIQSITVDGKRGLFNVFKDYPTQMCQFHQKRIIQRYITMHPKLEASIELKKLMSRLKYSNETRFTKALDNWYLKYKDFLSEVTFHTNSGKNSYTHKKLISAYRSIRANLKYLFTYKNYKELSLPNTTNLIEGGVFSPLKILIKIHRGLSKSLKLKIVDDYLVSHKKK
jgi:hypothetical protein